MSRAVRDTLVVDSVVLVRRDGADPTIIADGAISADALREYQKEWSGRLTGERRRWAKGLRAWAREDVWPKCEVTRSEYYNEYCVPAGFRDSAGMSVSGTSDEEIVVYAASGEGARFTTDGREALLLSLLQPGLEAAARAMARSSAPKRLLDTLDVPVALVDVTGTVIHANPSFAALLKRGSREEAVMQAARRLALELGTLTSSRDRTRPRGVSPTLTWHSPDGTLTLDATMWESTGMPCGPLCVISATVGHPAPDISMLQETWGLTRREAEVAALLARGCRNREVARTLAISEHTARRHTERVLRKMGAASRAQIAAIAGVPASRLRTSASA